jgi:hypothetical protein
MFAGPVDGYDFSLEKTFCLSGRRCFEGFAMRAKPDVDDAVATHPLVDTARNRLYLWQFRHWIILEGEPQAHPGWFLGNGP